MYDVENNKFFVSRDVVFNEDVFPFRTSSDDESNSLGMSINETTFVDHDDPFLLGVSDRREFVVTYRSECDFSK